MNKSEIYVEITNEQQRLRAIEILDKAGESVLFSSIIFYENSTGKLSFSEQWSLTSLNFRLPRKTHQITLEQLEEMLMLKNQMKQTAVDWLVSNIDWQLLKNTSLHYEMIVKKAKEMERERIIDFAEEFSMQHTYKGTVQDYYNETFNQ
jgi:hypothetical protein